MGTGKTEETLLGERFDDALTFARQVHATQLRKQTKIPYVSHLLSVASLVLENGGGEDEAIAALLHDAAEDQGGATRLAEIRTRFGDRVAEIVDGCTDTVEEPKPDWKPRKEKYLKHLPQASASIQLVSAADKLHNARSILADYREIGEALWSRFRATRDETLWYYRSVVEALRPAGPTRLVDEIDRTIRELEREIDLRGERSGTPTADLGDLGRARAPRNSGG